MKQNQIHSFSNPYKQWPILFSFFTIHYFSYVPWLHCNYLWSPSSCQSLIPNQSMVEAQQRTLAISEKERDTTCFVSLLP